MENIKISKENLIKVKDGIIFILLFLWMSMPILQTIRGIYEIIDLTACYFVLMKIIGVIGILLGTFTIYNGIKKTENKKETLKELIPIFLFIIYMIWTLISCLLSSNTKISFNGTSYRKEGYFMYLNYAGYFLCAFLLDSKKLKKILLNTFIIASVFLILISRITLSGERYTNVFVNTSIENTVFAQFNHYCYFLMMSLMCSLGLFLLEKNKIKKIFYGLAYVLICYAMIYNDTFGSYLAVSISLILYAIYAFVKKKDKVGISIAIVVFILLSIFTTKDNRNVVIVNIENFAIDLNAVMLRFGIGIEGLEKEDWEIRNEFMAAGTNRGELWHNAFNFVLRNPIIGYGADNLEEQYNRVLMKGSDRPHNLILYLACVSGIPGMLLYLTAVGIIIVKGVIKLIKNNENGKIFLLVAVTYMISSLFGNSMFYTSPFFFIFLGSLMRNNLIKKEE